MKHRNRLVEDSTKEFNYMYIDSEKLKSALNESTFRVRGSKYICKGKLEKDNQITLFYQHIDDDRDMIIGVGKTMEEVVESIKEQIQQIIRYYDTQRFLGKVNMLYQK